MGNENPLVVQDLDGLRSTRRFGRSSTIMPTMRMVPDVLAGKTIQEVGSNTTGNLLGEHPARSFEKINEASCRAVREIKDPEKIVHLSYGDFPAREYLQHILSFRGFRVYDIAKLIGAARR